LGGLLFKFVIMAAHVIVFVVTLLQGVQAAVRRVRGELIIILQELPELQERLVRPVIQVVQAAHWGIRFRAGRGGPVLAPPVMVVPEVTKVMQRVRLKPFVVARSVEAYVMALAAAAETPEGGQALVEMLTLGAEAEEERG
jgi:hypothetical protein